MGCPSCGPAVHVPISNLTPANLTSHSGRHLRGTEAPFGELPLSAAMLPAGRYDDSWTRRSCGQNMTPGAPERLYASKSPAWAVAGSPGVPWSKTARDATAGPFRHFDQILEPRLLEGTDGDSLRGISTSRPWGLGGLPERPELKDLYGSSTPLLVNRAHPVGLKPEGFNLLASTSCPPESLYLGFAFKRGCIGYPER
ncbi:hypothetical protein GOP47_0012270 [Adiantum capillus-veneris]|uniref:Uncharacterized protein n=1 Tax=Adiantum capillus-veneris TaxID=13818 RepID=A0A9D4UQV5_ADICA|nr:hypothetical protein GOP47_0012270 [Adiantum capillus-veneris]